MWLQPAEGFDSQNDSAHRARYGRAATNDSAHRAHRGRVATSERAHRAHQGRAATSSDSLPAPLGELHSDVEPLMEALSRDGPRSSHHASEAEGFWMPKSAWEGIQKVWQIGSQCATCPAGSSAAGSSNDSSTTQQQLTD